MIEDFARAKGVRLEKTGKIMVANDEDGERRLEEFRSLGEALGGEGPFSRPRLADPIPPPPPPPPLPILTFASLLLPLQSPPCP